MLRSNLKPLMEQRGITLRQMVEDTGLAEMTIIRARRGQIGACRLDTLVSIAGYLGCTVNDLFSQDEAATGATEREKPADAAHKQDHF
ncbi:MAG: helix-turn-helix transcriptional regulator [Desulfovibrio sp.]|nr:helix-turn-helix transcriptional regulator [Desulfovibrio sp.]